jgi:hypothetical protein
LSPLPKINFREIREHETSQQRAFEELCYQIVPTIHALPAGARLERRQAPDGGIEFSCVGPDGKGRWAWQAKYLFNLNAAAYAQMDRSATDAIDSTPDLRKYIFLLPTERTGRANNQGLSGLDQWREHINEWAREASKTGKKVDFEFVGHSDLMKALVDPRHAGAVRYFFQKDFLEPKWFEDQTRREIADLGQRFRPEVSVDLEVGDAIEGIALSGRWRLSLDEARDQVRLHDLRDPGLGGLVAPAIEDARLATQSLLDQLVADWAFLSDPTQPALANARAAAVSAEASLAACESAVRDALRSLPADDGGKALRDACYRLENELRAVGGRLSEVRRMLVADERSNGAMVLEGPAGCGKSHLLADVTQRRVSRGVPTVLLLGQKFEMGDPWAQIAAMVGLNLTRDELLESLSVAAAVAGKGRCVLAIDAINEHVGIDLWPGRLAGVLADIARYPWIAVVLSIRSTYLEQILDGVSVHRIHHPGLAGHEEEALERYAAFYRLRLTDLPPLLPELENPLFLGSLCRALVGRGLVAIPRDGVGASWVFDGLIDAVERSLGNRLDFARATHPVRDAVSEMARTMLDHDVDALPWTEAQRICDGALPRGNRHSQSLLGGMLAEGLLLEETRSAGVSVRFSYQRMSDHLVARELVRRAGDAGTVRSTVQGLVELPNSWRLRGLIEALSVVVPEEMSLELIDVLGVVPTRAPRAGRAYRFSMIEADELAEHFMTGLPWRRPAAVTARTISVAEALLDSGLIDRDRWIDLLVRVACVPDHPLNATRTDELLYPMELHVRDREWSTYAVGVDGIPSPVDRILHWALRNGRLAGDDVRPLAGLLLGWFLTSPDRQVRDRATKGLVTLFDRHPNDLAGLIDHFGSVNDPYVVERVLAAACGWALRHRGDGDHDLDAWELLLVSAFDHAFAGVPPEHLMIRHYAREVVQRAAAVLCSADRTAPRDISLCDPPYVSPWPLKPPTRRALETAYGKDGHWTVIGEWDDFYRYTITGAVRDFVPEGQARLKAIRGRQLVRDRRRASQALDSAFAALSSDAASRVESLVRPGARVDRDLEAISPELARAWREYDHIRWREGRSDEEVRIEPDIVARSVSQRVLDLGWTQDRFGTIDRWLGRHRDRSAAPVDRIAKKYAWIGLYEALGRIADHSVIEAPYGRAEPVAYEGPWQVGYSTDIDPSYVFADQGASRQRTRFGEKWWMAPVHQLDGAGDDGAWLRSVADLPDTPPLLVRRDPNGRDWVALEAHAEWERRSDRPKVGMTEDRRELWIRTQSYLLHDRDEQRVSTWASSHNWMGIHIPAPSDWHEGYLGSYPDLPPWPHAFAIHFEEEDGLPDGWLKTSGLGPRLQLTVAHYALDRERDFSNDDSTTRMAILPAPALISMLGARWAPSADLADGLALGPNERERSWVLGREIVAFHTGPRDEDNPSAMLIRADVLSKALVDHALILWTWILGEKHYWLDGQPTRQRQELYAAARLAPGGWQQWGRSVDYVDHETDRRTSLVRERA